MGWAVGFDTRWNRDIGYGIPAVCDHPDCNEEIDRGLAYVCAEQQPYGGENGCGLYFCEKHRNDLHQCERCENEEAPFDPKPDTEEWLKWKLTDESWGRWRSENPNEVKKIEKLLQATGK